MSEKTNSYNVLAVAAVLLFFLFFSIAGSAAFAREAESGGGSGASAVSPSGSGSASSDNSSGSSAVGSGVGSNGGLDSARDIEERGTGVSPTETNDSRLDSARDVLERGAGAVDNNTGTTVSGSDDFVNGAKLRGDGTVDDEFDQNLGLGDRNDDVARLQHELEVEGVFSGEATGFFGEDTRGAVMEFQREHGLPETGFVGPMTRTELNNQRTASEDTSGNSSQGGNAGPSDDSGQSSAPLAVRILGGFFGMLARLFGFGQ